MIDYFKYTNGNSFTLSGEDYQGLFNITDGKAYTGKSFSSNSKLLSGNNMFLADCFLQEFEFDRTTSEVRGKRLTQPFISPRNVIDQNFIDTNLQLLHVNNLNIYALSIIANPNIFDFVNSAKNGNAYFLGLSSGKLDLRNDDTKLSKTNTFPIQIDPFKDTEKVPGVDVLDNTVDSELFVYDDESFYYFITTNIPSETESTETANYTFSGSFVNNGSLVRVEDHPFQGSSKFSYDNNTDTLYALRGPIPIRDSIEDMTVGFEYHLNLYDNSFINPCRVFKLVDRMSLQDSIADDRVNIGNNILGYRFNPRLDAMTIISRSLVNIRLLNKDTFDLLTVISSGNTDEYIISFDIRDTDDSILVLTSLGPVSEAEEFYTYHLDIDTVTQSDEYILPNTPRRVYRYTPNIEFQRKAEITVKFSSVDSNVFVIDDQGAVSTRFISNPRDVASFPSMKNLLYLDNMFFDTTYEQFNLIEKKFNSNLLPSNSYNNLSLHVVNNDTDLFYFLHNIGRIYLIKESTLTYLNLVPLDLKRLYEKIISCESSLGISINSELQTIIKDAVNVFLNASIIPHKEYIDGIPVLGKYLSYEGLEVNFRDFEFHENEELNYDTVSRVFDEIYKLQQAVFDIIISGSAGLDEYNDSDDVVQLDDGELPAELRENLYTPGGEYKLEGAEEDYFGFYHIHPESGAMVGPKHTDRPHAKLIYITAGGYAADSIIDIIGDEELRTGESTSGNNQAPY